MNLEQACAKARERRDLYSEDVHVLQAQSGDYFPVLDRNVKIFLKSNQLKNQNIHYTAWNLRKSFS